jgi:hypothetical protein
VFAGTDTNGICSLPQQRSVAESLMFFISGRNNSVSSLLDRANSNAADPTLR